MKYINVIFIFMLIGCAHKMANYHSVYDVGIDTAALTKLSVIEKSFVAENIYYINQIDSLPNGVFVIWAAKEGRTYKILTHQLRDYEKLGNDYSDKKIEVGKSYPLILQSWKETCKPKDLYEFCCAISGCEYYGNYVTINKSDVADLFFANNVDGLILPN